MTDKDTGHSLNVNLKDYPSLIPEDAVEYVRLWAYVRYLETGQRQLVMSGLHAWYRMRDQKYG